MTSVKAFIGWIVDFLFNVSLVPFVLLLAITAIDVIARYIFNTAFFDTMTLSTMCLVVLNWFGLPYVTLKKEHVCVDLFVCKMSPRTKAFFDIFSSLSALVLFIMIAWYGVVRAIESYKSGEFEGFMELPVYPAKIFFATGAVLTAVVFLFLAVESIKNFITKRAADECGAPENVLGRE